MIIVIILMINRMGTHPSGPAKLDGKDELLSDWLKANATAVGFVPSGYVADDLPYLFKVLSVRTALSIQVLKSFPTIKKHIFIFYCVTGTS